MAKTSGYKDKFDAMLAECQKNFDALSQDISAYATNTKSLNESATQIIKGLEEKIVELQGAYDKIFEHGDEEQLNLIEDIEDSHKRITDWYNEIDKIRREILGYTRFVKGEPIASQVVATMDKNAYITENGKYYEKNSEKIPGLIGKVGQNIEDFQEDLSILENRIESFFAEKNSLFTQKFDELSTESDVIKRKIRELLPESMAVGHAAAYYAAKQTHGRRISLWSTLFICSMIGIFSTALYLNPATETALSSGLESFLLKVLYLLPFEIPFIWLAIFSGKKISEHSRLYEEYLHKWAVSRTFVGMLDSAKDIDGPIAELYAHILTSYAFNPSTVLDKKVPYGTPLEAVKESVFEPAKEILSDVKDTIAGKTSTKEISE